MARQIAMHFCAPNDSNGNPRRVFVVYRTSDLHVVAAVDEGYEGDGALRRRFGNLPISNRVDVTPGFYRAMLKEHGEK